MNMIHKQNIEHYKCNMIHIILNKNQEIFIHRDGVRDPAERHSATNKLLRAGALQKAKKLSIDSFS